MVGAVHRLGDRLDRLEVALARDREAGLDHVDAESRQLLRDLELLADVEGDPGRLLAVTQGGVEDLDVVAHRRSRFSGFGQRKTSPARRHEEASASTEGRSQLDKEQALGAQFLVHEAASLAGERRSQPSGGLAWENHCMRKGVKRALGLGVLARRCVRDVAGVREVTPESKLTWQTRPFPYPPEPVETPRAPASADAKAEAEAERPGWIDGADGECPASHPVKAKLASGIFHEPGGANYDRTQADRCYASAAAAETDGLRPAKR